MNSINTIKAGLTSITDPEGREFTAQTLLEALIAGHEFAQQGLVHGVVVYSECSGQNEWTQYERSRNRVHLGEEHQLVRKGLYGTDLMQGPVPYRPKSAPSKEGRDQSEDYRVGAQYQVVGHQHERHGRVWTVYNWFGQRVTAYARTYDRAHIWRDHWQNEYEQYGQYLKGNSTDEEVIE